MPSEYWWASNHTQAAADTLFGFMGVLEARKGFALEEGAKGREKAKEIDYLLNRVRGMLDQNERELDEKYPERK
jgi:hypothetical protein